MWNVGAFAVWGKSGTLDLAVALGRRKQVSRSDRTIENLCLGEQRFKVVATQPNFKVTKQGEKTCNAGFGARMLWGVSGFRADVFRNCCHNEAVSLDGRVGKMLPQHMPGMQEKVAAEWKQLMKVAYPVITSNVKQANVKIPFLEWSSSFPPAKREMFKALKTNGYEAPFKPVASSFIKQELVLRPDVVDAVVKDPRMIQGCPPELSLECGPYVRVAAKQLRKGMKPRKWNPGDLDRGRHFVYTCGMTAEGMGYAYAEAIRLIESLCGENERVVVLEDDQSRYDEHITEAAFNCANRLHGRLLPRHVARFLKRSNSKGRTSLGTKYSVPYTMQSGWPDTSYTDSLLNMAMKLYIHGPGRKWISIICGDDSVTITTNKELAAIGGVEGITAKYAMLGMEVEAVVRDTPDLAEFCSARFFPVKEDYILFPKTGKFFGRMGWDMTNRTSENELAWGRGVLNTLIEFGKVDPVVAALARSVGRQLGSGRVIEDADSEWKLHVVGNRKVPKSDVYYYYLLHYNYSAHDVDSLIGYLDNDNFKLFEPNSSPLIQGLVEADC